MNTNNKTQKIALVITFLAFLSGVGYYIYTDLLKPNSISDDNITQNNEVSDLEQQIRSAISADGNFDIDIIPIDQTDKQIEIDIPVPDLNRNIIFSVNYPQVAREISLNNINKLRNELKADESLYEQWINLGLQYKIAGDYEGARSSWEYAGALRPQNSISFHNLGDLYGYFLKNTEKAEKNFIKAVENSPNNIMFYFKLTEFYRDVTKDIEKAQEVVQKGLENNPNSLELKALLESLN